MDPAWTTQLKCEGSPHSVSYYEQENVIEVIIGEDASNGPAVEFLDAQTGDSLGTVQTTGQVTRSEYAESQGVRLMCTNKDRLYAVDTPSVTVQWETRAGQIGLVTKKKVYSYADATLWAHDLSTGTQEWEHILPDSVNRSRPIWTVDDTLYVEIGDYNDSGLVALDPPTGTEDWQYRPGDVKNFYIDNSGLYVKSFSSDEREDQVARIDEATGVEQWSFTCMSQPRNHEYGEHSLFVREYLNGTAAAIDSVAGTLNWRSEEYYDCEGIWLGDSALYVDGEGSYDDDFENVFHAVDLDSGRTKWETEIDDSVGAVDIDGLSDDIYIGTHDFHDEAGSVYRVNKRTGRVQWRSYLGERVIRIYPEANLILVVTNGEPNKVYALINESGQVLWSVASENELGIKTVTNERFIMNFTDMSSFETETHIRRLADKNTEIKFSDISPISGGGALFVVSDGEASGYPVANDPEAFQGRVGRTSPDPTKIYTPGSEESDDPAEPSDTEVYEPNLTGGGQASPGDTLTIEFCPSCGAELSEFGDVQFCPSCGSRLPD